MLLGCTQSLCARAPRATNVVLAPAWVVGTLPEAVIRERVAWFGAQSAGDRAVHEGLCVLIAYPIPFSTDG